MGLPINPQKAIFPIVEVSHDRENIAYYFSGTGFFIDKSGMFFTAKHVCQDTKHKYEAVDIIAYGQVKSYPISNIKISKDYDIALGKVDGFPDIEALSLATENPPINYDILTAEYSGTILRQIEQKKALIFNPFSRKGHIIRFYLSTFPERKTTSCLEISFPALKGASGAPIVLEKGGSVVGMIVENVEHELLQSHLETVTSGQKHIEEIKYNLPYAKAISWKHLTEFLSQTNK